jgi:predicted GNAT superfamily acetyltransferase
MPNYVIRPPANIEEYGQIADVYQAVFALRDRANPPAWLMEDTTKVGGLTLGLWDGDKGVGFSYAFAGLDSAGPYLYSSGLGVLPEHRSRCQAYEMKVVQRTLARELGYRRIKWTFSALRSVNAHVYITRLGGVGSKYVFDTRGSFDSDWVTEGGVPLDEFVVEWNLDSERVSSRVSDAGASAEPARPDEAYCISRCSGAGPDRVLDEIDTEPAAERVVCEVPADFQYLVNNALDLAMDWRAKTRPAFAALTGQGFALTECFYDREHGPRYLFERSPEGTARS